ncbi:M23 family metallopeptidase [Cohnella fermenti]|uniref:M23ase beta-sheet core domain-containing protein n=1 Tax=Cohnella fermenti TaxID=2565925 RepID=A0A4S4BHK8_9BACL|nr:M23 family metallopeptidase [Cohnella fermenti]THF73915.1 hypothetical protein E6C55_26970 [Cohnella fermenti]
MLRTLPIALVLLLTFAAVAQAENASVLLKMYGISATDPVEEEAKLSLLEEEYSVKASEVSSNTMLAAAYELMSQYSEEVLAGMDSEIYALSDELNAIEAAMGASKEQDVATIMELDSQYRTAAARLEEKRRLRDEWTEAAQAQPLDVPSQEKLEQDKSSLNSLGDKVDRQRQKYEQALEYPELGEVTSFKSPLAIPVRMTSGYGVRLDPITRDRMTFHSGMDMGAPIGTAVLAAFNGYVEEASRNEELGYYVILNHGRGIKTLYGHLSGYQVEQGQQVKQYEPIAESGNTGSRSTGPHLHFGLFINGRTVDPGILVPH